MVGMDFGKEKSLVMVGGMHVFSRESFLDKRVQTTRREEGKMKKHLS